MHQRTCTDGHSPTSTFQNLSISSGFSRTWLAPLSRNRLMSCTVTETQTNISAQRNTHTQQDPHILVAIASDADDESCVAERSQSLCGVGSTHARHTIVQHHNIDGRMLSIRRCEGGRACGDVWSSGEVRVGCGRSTCWCLCEGEIIGVCAVRRERQCAAHDLDGSESVLRFRSCAHTVSEEPRDQLAVQRRVVHNEHVLVRQCCRRRSLCVREREKNE